MQETKQGYFWEAGALEVGGTASLPYKHPRPSSLASDLVSRLGLGDQLDIGVQGDVQSGAGLGRRSRSEAPPWTRREKSSKQRTCRPPLMFSPYSVPPAFIPSLPGSDIIPRLRRAILRAGSPPTPRLNRQNEWLVPATENPKSLLTLPHYFRYIPHYQKNTCSVPGCQGNPPPCSCALLVILVHLCSQLLPLVLFLE